MIRTLSLASVVAVALALPAAAENTKVDVPTTENVSSSAKGAGQGDSGLVVAADKTSDRTPGNATPQRTPGASLYGAVGTEIGKTPDGTSDRTPGNHYRPATN